MRVFFLSICMYVCIAQTPVIALVGNDACWSQIAREQVPMLGSDVACMLAVSPRVSLFISCTIHIEKVFISILMSHREQRQKR